jgi:hypothetical protein
MSAHTGIRDRVRAAEHSRTYRLANVEKVRATKQAQYLKNRKKILARVAEYSKRRRLEKQGVAVDPISIALRNWK